MSKSNVKTEKNYWPHSIIAGIVFIVIACIATIKVALDNPVQMDSFYLDRYQNVDRNYNQLQKAQKEFEKNFSLSYQTKKFNMNQPNSFSMSIQDLNKNTLVENAEVKLVISRPETNEFNQEFILKNPKNGVFEFHDIKINKPGRWQILTLVTINGLQAYNKHEVFAN
ncbi:MAG: hypothetical protein PWQ42_585 [Sulfurospirillum sp.]|jgi:hypothetical protein|nr:hypothetical protein [Sulfurospirillum sp.]DAB31851.1 MAG TPA: 4-hydroxy-3-methylbut-2-en-1-yl diphosphate synthase [Sulfurospirillum sp. UBA11407]